MARRKKDEVLGTGEVTVEKGDKSYTARYEVLRGGFVRLTTRDLVRVGGSAHIGALSEESIARRLLNEAISSGLADREGWGRPKPPGGNNAEE